MSSLSSNLVFLCGFPSSGTDLLKNIVNAHSDIAISGEFPLLPSLAGRYGPLVEAEEVSEVVTALNRCDVYRNFAHDDFVPSGAAQSYTVAEIYRAMLGDDAVAWGGNKTPQNTEHIEELNALFPHAKFIVIVRDIRDVALSWHQKWGKDKILCAAKWQSRMQSGYRAAAELGSDRVLFLRYEDLLVGLELIARRICAFLGLDFERCLLDFHTQMTHRMAGKRNYGKALLSHNTAKWRQGLTAREIRRIEEIAYDGLAGFEYPITLATGPRRLTPIEQYRGLARDVIALIVVGNRELENQIGRYKVKTACFELRKLWLRRYAA